MKRIAGCVVVALTVAAIRVSAHHSFALFDMQKNVTFKGTVIEYRWSNPHVHVTMKIEPRQGVDPQTVGTWDLEAAGGTSIVARQGWTRATYKPGDHVKVVAHPMKDGVTKGASLFYAIMPDGKRLFHDIARPKGENGASASIQ